MKLFSKHKWCSCSKIEIYKTLVNFIYCIQIALILIVLPNLLNFGFDYSNRLIRFCDAAPNMSNTSYKEILNSRNKIKQVYSPTFTQRNAKCPKFGWKPFVLGNQKRSPISWEWYFDRDYRYIHRWIKSEGIWIGCSFESWRKILGTVPWND